MAGTERNNVSQWQKEATADKDDYFAVWAASQRTGHDFVAYLVQLNLQLGCYVLLSYKLPKTFRVKEELTLLSWHMLMVLVYIASIFLTRHTRFYVRYRSYLLMNLRVVNMAMVCSLAAATMTITKNLFPDSNWFYWWGFLALFVTQGLYGAPLPFQLQSIIGLAEVAVLLFKPWETMSKGGEGLSSWMNHMEMGNLTYLLFQFLCVIGAVYILPLQHAKLRDKRLTLSLLGGEAATEHKRIQEMLEKHKTKRQ